MIGSPGLISTLAAPLARPSRPISRRTRSEEAVTPSRAQNTRHLATLTSLAIGFNTPIQQGIRRLRPAPAVRDGHDPLAVPAAPGRTGVAVRRAKVVAAVGAVSIDRRPGHRARLADMRGGRHGRRGLQAAGQPLRAARARVAEIQLPGLAAQSAAWQIRRPWATSVHGPHHHPHQTASRTLTGLLGLGPGARRRAGRLLPDGAPGRR